MKKLAVILMVLTLLAAAGCTQSSKAPTSGTLGEAVADQVKDQLFVNAAWLKANLDKVIVLDVRKVNEYASGHIPGAVNSPWQSLANMIGQSGDAGWGTVLPANELAAKLGSMGINGEKTVVTYGAPPGWGDEGRVLWVLNMAGITNVKMLDGGWDAWQAIGGEESQENPVPAAVSYTIAELNQDLNVTTKYIAGNQTSIKIVDVRTPKEYSGAVDFGEARGGHLPGAISLPFENMFNEDGTIKGTEDLKILFTEAGLTPGDEIVTYCTKGIRSGYMTMVLRNLGFSQARNYDASFYEWAGNKGLPIE